MRTVLATLLVGMVAGSGVEEAPAPEPDSAASLRLVVNTSARKLYVYENGERTRTYTVAVGKPGHRTPTGNYAISRVIWNPWWRPPARDWARGAQDTPPGPGNPMGRVKMYFRDLYYIHGTPNKSSLGQAASHGCVRMSNGDAIQLARLVHDYGGGVSDREIDRLITNSSRTREVWLKRKVPVEIVSGSASVKDERLRLYAVEGAITDDELVGEALEALQRAGVDVDALDHGRLLALVEESRHGPVAMSLDELVAPVSARGPTRSP